MVEHSQYGRYYGPRTTILRAGCLSGPSHASAELHGFLACLMKCFADGHSYTIFGHHGKQVRDSIHSRDLVRSIDAVRSGYDEGYGQGFSRLPTSEADLPQS